MAFYPNDFYTTSGTATITNSWTSTVYKHDSSSFYNWEQDNLPLYDLEERTHLAWERLGHAASSVAGMNLTVSSNGDTTLPMVFTSITDAMASVPDVIRYPVIIEVAASGDLGQLDIKNKQFEGGGSLEIINRVFMKAYNASSTWYDSASPMAAYGTGNAISSLDLQNTFTDTVTMHRGEATSQLWSGTDAQRLFLTSKHLDTFTGTNASKRPGRLTCAEGVSAGFGTTNIFGFGIGNHVEQDEATSYLNASNKDLAVTSQLTGSSLERSFGTDVLGAGGLLYGNYFSRVRILNSPGPVYIRGFCVDGGNGASPVYHGTERGFEVVNSNPMLENCASIRCTKAGFDIKNSDVTLSRGIFAFRNYHLSFGAGYNERESTETVGIKLSNSKATIRTDNYASGSDFLFHTSRNVIGLELDNSELVGGQALTLSGMGERGNTIFNSSYNTGEGIRLSNSVLNLDGRLDVYNNQKGIVTNNSELLLDELTVENSQEEGLLSFNSIITYNKNLHTGVTSGTSVSSSYYDLSADVEGSEAGALTQNYFVRNGQHLVLNNSVYDYTRADNVPSKMGKSRFAMSHGVAANTSATSEKTLLPSLEINAGSKCSLAHTRIRTHESASNNGYKRAIMGAALRSDNSNVRLLGSGDTMTLIEGPPNYTVQNKIAGVAAVNNSRVEFNGPVAIVQFGVDALADNHSTISFAPHNEGGLIDASGWALSSTGNHTHVELHSTRANLVANNDSIIEMKDLGWWENEWAVAGSLSALGATASAADYGPNDGFGISSFTYGGSMQLYPNPQIDVGLADLTLSSTPSIESFTECSTTSDLYYFLSAGNYDSGTTPADIRSSISKGGVCVRAVGNSKVDVKNTHFPARWSNPYGIIYDVSTGNTYDELRIWNIADSSKLDAAYCSVNSLWPESATYYGPDSYYLSGGVIASGAPSGTPDTGVSSILDNYGDSNANRGPFRIYFSPLGPAKFLAYDTSNYGAPYQQLAQGYNPSGDCTIASSVSSLYKTLDASSEFFYVSSMLDSGIRPNIWLDESAANTFANAKNATMGTSGRLKLVNIYRAITEDQGEGSDATTTKYGKGFFSANIFDLDRDN